MNTALRLVQRLRKAPIVLLPLAIAWSAPVGAQSAGQWRDAAHIYGKTCAYCHEVGVGPALLGRQLVPEYVIHAVRHGRLAMPAFLPTELLDAEVEKVARMVHDSAAAPAPARGEIR